MSLIFKSNFLVVKKKIFQINQKLKIGKTVLKVKIEICKNVHAYSGFVNSCCTAENECEMTKLENARRGPLPQRISIDISSLVVKASFPMLLLVHSEVDNTDWFFSPSGI